MVVVNMVHMKWFWVVPRTLIATPVAEHVPSNSRIHLHVEHIQGT